MLQKGLDNELILFYFCNPASDNGDYAGIRYAFRIGDKCMIGLKKWAFVVQ